MPSPRALIFALGPAAPLGERVARALGVALSPCEERDFADGEHKTRPLESVRGQDVFVVDSLHRDATRSVNDKLCRLLFFIGALRDAGAGRVTAVLPYLCYARKDRRTKHRDPVTTRYVARFFESVGTDCVVTLEVHDLAAFENAHRCRTEHLVPDELFAAHLAPRFRDEEVVLLSPDIGGFKRADRFKQVIERSLGRPVDIGAMEKRRSGDVVGGEKLIAEVAGKVVVIIDDLIGSGETIRRAAVACEKQGAARIYAAAAHGLFVGGIEAVCAGAPIDGLVVTDSVVPLESRPAAESVVTVLDSAPLLARAIERLSLGGFP